MFNKRIWHFWHSDTQVRNLVHLAKQQKLASMISMFSLFHKNLYHALSTNAVFWLSLLNCKSWQITGIMSFNYYNSKSLPRCSVAKSPIYNFFSTFIKLVFPCTQHFFGCPTMSIFSRILQTTWKSLSQFHLEWYSRTTLNCDNGYTCKYFWNNVLHRSP